jgi:hypothetical protein
LTSDQVLAQKQLDVREMNKFLALGYEEDISFGRNLNGKDWYLAKFEKDGRHPLLRKEEKLKNKIKGQEARIMIDKLEHNHQEYLKREEERLEKRQSRNKNNNAREKKRIKREAERLRTKRLEKCKQNTTERAAQFKKRLHDLKTREEKYIKRFLTERPLYQRKRGLNKKAAREFKESRLREVHESHNRVTLEDIKRHQENIKKLKAQVPHNFHPQTLPEENLEFYNNSKMRSLGNNVSNYPNPFFYSGKHDKAYFESEIDNPTTKGHVKSQFLIPQPEGGHPEPDPQKSTVVKYKPFLSFKQIGRDELLYYQLKRKKFAQNANAQNAADFESNNKGRSLKKLPQLKKEHASQAQRDQISKIQHINQSLPSLYLDYSRAMGRKSLIKNLEQGNPDFNIGNGNGGVLAGLELGQSVDFGTKEKFDK